jgi:hypothetical protein
MESTIALEANYQTAFYTVTHVGPHRFDLSMEPNTWEMLTSRTVQLGSFRSVKSAKKYMEALETRRMRQRLDEALKNLTPKEVK